MLMLKENARFLRKLWKVKWAETVDVLGFPRSTWGNYESGISQPVLSDLKRICLLFGITENDLLNTDLSRQPHRIRNKYRPVTTESPAPQVRRLPDAGADHVPENYYVAEPERKYGTHRAGDGQPEPVMQTLQATIRSQEAIIKSLQDTISSLRQALSRAYEDIDALKKDK